MKIFYKKYSSITDVPVLIYDWAKLIGGSKITVNEINELIDDYQKYTAKLDDIEQLDSTIDQ